MLTANVGIPHFCEPLRESAKELSLGIDQSSSVASRKGVPARAGTGYVANDIPDVGGVGLDRASAIMSRFAHDDVSMSCISGVVSLSRHPRRFVRGFDVAEGVARSVPIVSRQTINSLIVVTMRLG